MLVSFYLPNREYSLQKIPPEIDIHMIVNQHLHKLALASKNIPNYQIDIVPKLFEEWSTTKLVTNNEPEFFLNFPSNDTHYFLLPYCRYMKSFKKRMPYFDCETLLYQSKPVSQFHSVGILDFDPCLKWPVWHLNEPLSEELSVLEWDF